MAGTTGLEPATSAVTGQRSNQLSYVPRTTWILWSLEGVCWETAKGSVSTILTSLLALDNRAARAQVIGCNNRFKCTRNIC